MTARYTELEAAYSQAIKSGIEQNKLAVIAKLKELKMQVLEFYGQARAESSEIINKFLNDCKPEIKYKPVEGFGFGKIAGYDDIKNILNREFISKIKLEREGKDVNIPGVFAFFGPRGNGKTTSTLAIAEETGCIVEKIDARPFDSPETVFEKFKKLFEKSSDNFAQDGRRIIFMDEFTKFNKGEESKKQFAELLKDCSDKYKCTFFGATNNLSQAGDDFMALKPVLVAFEPPSKYNAIQVLKHYLRESADSNINYKKVVDKLFDYAQSNDSLLTNSDLKGIAKIALSSSQIVNEQDLIMAAIKRFARERFLPLNRVKNFAEDYEKYMK